MKSSKHAPYRSPGATRIHWTILAYIKDPTHSHYAEYKKSLKEATEDDLLERSINFYSHLKDILHIPYTIIPEVMSASKVSKDLFIGLMHAVKNYPTAHKKLLIEENRNFTPLHDVLSFGLEENVRIFLQTLEDAEKNKIISKEELSELLTAPDSVRNLTPLFEILFRDRIDILKLYLNFVKKMLDRGIIKPETFFKLFTHRNLAGFPPLHTILIAGDIEKIKIFLEVLAKAASEGFLSQDKYKALLMETTIHKYSPLHQAVRSGSIIVVREFVSLLEKNFDSQELAVYLNNARKSLQCLGKDKEKIDKYIQILMDKYPRPREVLIERKLIAKSPLGFFESQAIHGPADKKAPKKSYIPSKNSPPTKAKKPPQSRGYDDRHNPQIKVTEGPSWSPIW